MAGGGRTGKTALSIADAAICGATWPLLALDRRASIVALVGGWGWTRYRFGYGVGDRLGLDWVW